MKINKFKRYQKGLGLEDLYPTIEGHCACGCGKLLIGRQRRWSSEKCRNLALTYFYVIKGDIEVIRQYLFNIDAGACRCCGEITKDWQADHIVPVQFGGGATPIDNFQTLCLGCHNTKTAYNAAHCKTTFLAEASNASNLRTYALGHCVTVQEGTCILKQNFLSTEVPFGFELRYS